MKSIVYTKFLLCLYLFSSHCHAFDHSHKNFTAVLKKHLDEKNFVKYKDLKKDSSQLNSYLNELRGVTKKIYNTWTPDQKKSFLINAYNAFTIKVIIEHYPVKSIKDIGSFFTNTWNKKFSYLKLLDGSIETLDGIEHATLRKNFPDYRIHAAVNCASISCPNLRNEAYNAQELESQLNEQMTLWLADTRKNKFTPAKKLIEISKIFSWYEEDFIAGGGLKKIILKFGPKSSHKTLMHKDYDVDYLSYNWGLNEA